MRMKFLTSWGLFLFIGAIFIMSQSLATSSDTSIRSKAKCLKAGGEWRSWTKYEGAKNIASCRIKSKDRGKPCSDGKECSTGLCEYDSATEAGVCFAYKNTGGCHSWMNDGKPQSTICKD